MNKTAESAARKAREKSCIGGFYAGISRVADRVCRFRYLLAAIVFAVCLLCRLSGSSVGSWSQILGQDDPPVIGVSRDARTDEWGMLTALCIAQEHNPAGAYSRYVPAGKGILMDQGIVYALPSWDLMTVFRPFYWGYLLFGSEVGLSWYWCGRFLALFLSMLEFGMMITDKNRALSLFLAICVCFAPFLQWWYAVNGLAEMLIYGAYFLVGLRYLMTGGRLWKKCLAAAGMALCAGGFVLVFYPAWMAPMAYGFLPVFLWLLITNRKCLRLTWQQHKFAAAVPWLLFAGLFAAGMGFMLVTSRETIRAVLNSVYPGRSGGCSGGGGFFWMLKYPFSLLLHETGDPAQIENSSVICFAPVGLLISLWVIVKERKNDLLLILLLGTEALLTWYYCIGFAPWLARLMLLSFTNGNRGPQVIGFLRLFLLARALACKKKQVKLLPSVAVGGTAAVFAVGMSWCYTRFDGSGCRYEYWQETWELLTVTAVLAAAFFLFLRYVPGRKKGALFFAGIIVTAAGIRINPIRSGIRVITDSAVYRAVRELAQAEPEAVWAEIDIDYPAANLVAMAGGNCLNTSQTYPKLSRWEIFGSDKAGMEIYNRYCHIRAVLGPERGCTLLGTDYVQMTLDEDALRELEVDYILTKDAGLAQKAAGWAVGLSLCGQYGDFLIYRCLWGTE